MTLDDLCKNARDIGEYATTRLNEMMKRRRLIGDVRGPGLFVSADHAPGWVSRRGAV